MITPDTKDWTWVLDRPCPECGLGSRSLVREDTAALLRGNAAAWLHMLATEEPQDLRRRPRPDKWSPLEYSCHVRDVFRIYAGRLDLMIRQDSPQFPNWEQDVTAVEERYGEQEPQRVAAQLSAAAEILAVGFDHVSGDQWQRTGGRSDDAHFTVETFARYLLHDLVHHLYDVTGAA